MTLDLTRENLEDNQYEKLQKAVRFWHISNNLCRDDFSQWLQESHKNNLHTSNKRGINLSVFFLIKTCSPINKVHTILENAS